VRRVQCETQRLPPRAQDSWALSEGDSIGDGRRIVTSLGGGVEHQVFVVDDERRGRCVAKIARPGLVACNEACDVLVSEAVALQHVASPGVVRCLDVQLRGSHPHLLLEYVGGPTLRERLRCGDAPSPVTVASLGAVIADALATVAVCGWVHLDVKPENIVAGGSPRLIDFSIARRACDAAAHPGVIGTLAYMAPEQRAADPSAPPVGPPADVYALAVTLYEATSGQLPAVEVPVPAVPAWLAAVLGPALDVDPGRRPTAASMAARLRMAIPSRAA
jgi:serine/threonine protein kinase